jgi:16S rRNA (cytidine1402-2'-O)-methyltransferase
MTMDKGTLYLVPAPLDLGTPHAPAVTEVLPELTLQKAAGLQHWVTENAKSLRAFLKRVALTHPLVCPMQELNVQELPRVVHKQGDHLPGFDARHLLTAAVQGHDVGLSSEAGMPAVADPGSSVVRAAHELGIRVVPLVGPVSLLLALAASGLNGQNFAFVGYLPQDVEQRQTRLKQLERLAIQTGQSQLWIETPYRNAAMFGAALQALQPSTRLCVASGLTLVDSQVRTRTVSHWRQHPWAAPSQTPAVFALGI